jgi:hypothetical protein
MLALAALADTDVVARAAVVEGYNSNTYQVQDNPAVPAIRRNPSPFTGLDGSLELRLLGRGSDRTTLLVGARFNHYEPLQAESESDDGAVNALLTSQITLSSRATLTLTDTASFTSFDAAHTTDGTLFVFDPTLARSTYWVDDFALAVAYELSPNWRYTQAAGVVLSGTVSSPSEHRGLDFVLPYVSGTLARDLSARSSADVSLLYQYAYQLYVLDFTRSPARDIGPVQASYASAIAGYTHSFSTELSTVLRAGAVVATAPPHDPDRRAVLSPTGSGELAYVRDAFDVLAAASYTWGTVNPRLGTGPTANASLLAIGRPVPAGAWANLAVVGTVQLSYASLVTGPGESSRLGLYAGGLEARYGFNDWLGVSLGYDVRYATFDTQAYEPPFMQHIVYAGLSAFWSTDREQLPITNFAPPVRPPA